MRRSAAGGWRRPVSPVSAAGQAVEPEVARTALAGPAGPKGVAPPGCDAYLKSSRCLFRAFPLHADKFGCGGEALGLSICEVLASPRRGKGEGRKESVSGGIRAV